MNKTVTGSCDICKAPIQAKDQGTFNQVLGFHKAKRHGVHADAKARARGYYYKKMGFSPEEIAHREAKFALANGEPAVERKPYTRKANDAEPIALKECPYCKSRFFGIKGDA